MMVYSVDMILLGIAVRNRSEVSVESKLMLPKAFIISAQIVSLN